MRVLLPVATGALRPRGGRMSLNIELIRGSARILGDEVSTDIHCSSKYLPGKDTAYIALHAFEQIAPGFANAFQTGDIIVAGANFGINSSREQAIHVMQKMGVAAIVAPSFGRQFFRNAINNGLPVIECDVDGIASGDAVSVDLTMGCVKVAARQIKRQTTPLPPAILSLLSAGGLIPYLQQYPKWQ